MIIYRSSNGLTGYAMLLLQCQFETVEGYEFQAIKCVCIVTLMNLRGGKLIDGLSVL